MCVQCFHRKSGAGWVTKGRRTALPTGGGRETHKGVNRETSRGEEDIRKDLSLWRKQQTTLKGVEEDHQYPSVPIKERGKGGRGKKRQSPPPPPTPTASLMGASGDNVTQGKHITRNTKGEALRGIKRQRGGKKLSHQQDNKGSTLGGSPRKVLLYKEGSHVNSMRGGNQREKGGRTGEVNSACWG